MPALAFLFALAIQEVPGSGQKLVEPAISTLASTIIGSLLIVALSVAVLAMWQLIRVQNARIEDQKAISAKQAELVEKMLLATSKLTNTLENLQRAEEANASMIQGMKNTFDLMLATRQFRPTPQAFPSVDPSKHGGPRR